MDFLFYGKTKKEMEWEKTFQICKKAFKTPFNGF